MKHVIVGTAGHVDHGKTALVKALTGQNTDRLKEEKERGISIDLGFAHLPLTDQIDASIIDVPGHERFLKNMLAGAGGIDIAMLVVAADEGIMPQTTEHLLMLQCYGVKDGLCVVSKIDTVDAEWLELITEEIRSHTADTFLAGASILPVSAITGEGMENLRTTLASLAHAATGRDETAPFRLWVDRVFTVKGHGAVVTGSILSGTVNAGQTLQLEPAGGVVKARGLESHGISIVQAVAGQRVAINLSGVDTETIKRGLLLTSPDRSERSRIWDVSADWLAGVKSGTRIRLHVGTGEWIGRLRLPGFLPKGVGRISLEHQLAAGCGERGIVRLYSPQSLLGGITLLAPSERFRPAAPAALADAVKNNDVPAMVHAIITTSSKPKKISEVLRACGYQSDADCHLQLQAMEKNGSLLRLGDSVLSSRSAISLADQLIRRLKQVHEKFPSAAGMSKEEARQQLNIDEKWFDHLLDVWRQDFRLEVSGGVIALASHVSAYSKKFAEINRKLETALGSVSLQQIDSTLLAKVTGISMGEIKPMYDSLLRSGDLVRLGDIIVYRKTLQYNVSIIQAKLQESSKATVAELRDLLRITRKLVIPLLEYCDMNKYTIRDGDVRRLGPRKPG